jgi:vitamin B12/bleomycin/antimicrobial peptide transport system ATP-binding/permease protein
VIGLTFDLSIAGKSSLLRAIAGLWTAGNGTIARPASVYFLPQRPYCTVGTLKDQLLYPRVENGTESVRDPVSDEELLSILEKVNLLDVAKRAGDGDPVAGLQAFLDWSNRLSLGEQQRLAFGRLLVNKPSLVIADEATSALDIESEAKMYTLLRNMAQRTVQNGSLGSSPLTYISVGHRPSLAAFHDKKLRLLGENNYEIETIEKSSINIMQTSSIL